MKGVLGMYFKTGVRVDGFMHRVLQPKLMDVRVLSHMVLCEQERKREVLSDALNERLSRDVPDLSSAKRQSKVQNLVERGDREMVNGQPPSGPERISEDGHISKGAHDTVQSGRSGVVERDGKDTTPGAATIRAHVLKEAADGFGPLKAVLRTISAVYADYKETVVIRNKIEDLLSRIVVLEVYFATLPGSVVERKRRSESICRFGGIERQLRSLSKKHGLQRLADHIQDEEEVPGLLEDLRETISDYQMARQMAMCEQACKLINPAEASVLNNFLRARGAEYRHGGRRGCLKGTRTAVLDEIELWTRDFRKPSVYWLNGLAGTGKSTIAQTIAERVFASGQLGASFFCSRDFEDRRNLDFIFPTLAVQLARKYTEFRSIFVPLVQSDPEIVHESLYNQMRKLIVEPLKESSISTVIVIDALDECKDVEPASAILSVLGQFVSEIPKVKFFLTGRPEPRIRGGFRIPLLAEATDVFVLHEVEPSRVDSDIRLFLRCSLLEIAGRRGGLDGWPTKEQLKVLCERAAGLFVYAVATVQFVDHRNNNPKKQLERLLRLPNSTVCEGKTELKANTTLDSLYASTLQEAFGNDCPEDDPKVRSVLGAVVLVANPLSPPAIGTLLGYDAEDVLPLLSSIHSLLILQEDVDQPVRPFHKSFPDFIVDPARCINRRFHVFPPNHHMELLIGCLNLMDQALEKNMCKLPDAVANSEIPDLCERTQRYISPALQYACKSWYKHLVDEHTIRTPEITSALHRFLEKKFVFWLEVLSVLGAAREAVDALETAIKWLEALPTVGLANDCLRFVTGFLEVIEESAAHVYHSALPLSPQMSMVRKLYGPHANPLTRIVRGLPDSWDPAIATLEYSCMNAAWSPCGRFIAISNSRSRTQILDAATLKRLTILESLLVHIREIIFSPDSRLLTVFNDGPEEFITWDIQTGVVVSAISPEQWDYDMECSSITYSVCGTMFGALIRRFTNYTIRTYNVHSGTHIYSHSIEGRVVSNIWAHGECLRFAVVKPGSITTREVGFASRNAPTEVESLPLPDNFPHNLYMEAFHPTLSRLAFEHSERIFVWDARRSEFLLNEHARDPHRASFSSDGRFFVYGTGLSDVHLWKESPIGYILHRKHTCEFDISSQFISPNGGLMFMSGRLAIQLWRTMDPSTSFSCKWTRERFIVEFSPDETLAAVARFKDKTITVLDLESGDPLSIIDTGMEVYGQRAAGSTVVVVGREKVVTWDLPAPDHVLNPRADVNDSIRTTTISCPRMVSHPHNFEFASISPDLHSIAILEDHMLSCDLHLHDVPTGQCLGYLHIDGRGDKRPWFTSDGREVWCMTYHGKANGLTITKDSESSVIELGVLGPTNQPPSTPPWLSSRGYKVMDDGWILGINGKRLLWLPPHWRPSNTTHKTWSGRFLALLHGTLPESVILELKE
ncbi:WD40 repeat-like protein [Thelephora ganbajun]|uniref:WD40 repeat-like protein n=1 Tax=Thelephora ganbajun TaxID=370292 RepID=A0ACB6Z9M3_THEGA|nr:WD40 repeat-like protein [Thelephora ganbajun]